MAEPKVPPDNRIKRRTSIDPGDYERVLIGIIDYLADKEMPVPEPAKGPS